MTEREWRRTLLRILAARGRRLRAQRFAARATLHPAHERHLRRRAFDGHTCLRMVVKG